MNSMKIIGNIILSCLFLFEIGYILLAPNRRDKELKKNKMEKSLAADSIMIAESKTGLKILIIILLAIVVFNFVF